MGTKKDEERKELPYAMLSIRHNIAQRESVLPLKQLTLSKLSWHSLPE